MTIAESLEKYLDSLRVNNLSRCTLAAARTRLKRLAEYLKAAHAVTAVETISPRMMTEFFADLRVSPSQRQAGKGLSVGTQNAICSTVGGYLRFLFKCDLTLNDLSREVPGKVGEHKLPRNVLSREDIEKICAVVPKTTLMGYRDRLVIELAYNSGLRISEILALRMADVDLKNEMIFVRQGKGNKDRALPMTSALKAFILEYVAKVRPYLKSAGQEDFLILKKDGGKARQCALMKRISEYGKAAGLGFPLCSHMFRHAFSVHLMRCGCDIKYISALLGHNSLSTTQIYTEIEDSDLRAKLEEYHFFKDTGKFGGFLVE